MWQDEKRSPGPWPQTRWAPIVVVLALIAGAAVGKIHSHVALGIFVLLIGLGAFWVAARMNQQRLADERYSRGPGWWLGWLISKTSVPVARGAYIVMGIGICALGLFSIVD
jgi:uncharacterized membrane protein YhaH (DUF805 family)